MVENLRNGRKFNSEQTSMMKSNKLSRQGFPIYVPKQSLVWIILYSRITIHELIIFSVLSVNSVVKIFSSINETLRMVENLRNGRKFISEQTSMMKSNKLSRQGFPMYVPRPSLVWIIFSSRLTTHELIIFSVLSVNSVVKIFSSIIFFFPPHDSRLTIHDSR